MTPQVKKILKQRLSLEEHLELKPYPDPYGNITIGYGHNLTIRGQANDPEFKNGITPQKADELLDEDIDWFLSQLDSHYPWFNNLSDNRQIALVDMCFNMGFKAFQGFTEMLKALAVGNWQKACDEIIDSDYYRELYVKLGNKRPLNNALTILTNQLH